MGAHTNYARKLLLSAAVPAVMLTANAAQAQEACRWSYGDETVVEYNNREEIKNPTGGYILTPRYNPECLGSSAGGGQLGLAATGKAGLNVTNQIANQAIDPLLGGGGAGGGGAPGYTATPISMFMISGINKVSHDGFDTTMSGASFGRTPEYDQLDTGFTFGVRLDGSKAVGLAPNTLTFGLFGNYTKSDIDLGAVPGYAKSGQVDVDSWSVGGYALVTDGWKYGMVTVSGTFGSPEREDFVYGSNADFNTTAVATSANLGMLVPLGSAKIDLRGAVTYVTVSGDDHTDSIGIRYTNAKLEDVTGSLSARLFGLIRTENGVLRPFVQGGVNQRFHYKSTITVEDTPFTFDDGDTTVFARAGVDFDLSRSTQAYVSVRGEQGEDVQAIAGQIGVTIKLD